MFFRRFLVLIALAGFFLGGYHLGRIPGSPDIIGGIGRLYAHIYGSVQSSEDRLDEKTDPPATSDIIPDEITSDNLQSSTAQVSR